MCLLYLYFYSQKLQILPKSVKNGVGQCTRLDETDHRTSGCTRTRIVVMHV